MRRLNLNFNVKAIFSRVEEKGILLIIVCLALILRGLNIGSNSLWIDEMWVMKYSLSTSLSEPLSEHLSQSINPPLFSVLEWLVYLIPVFEPETKLRLVPTIFSVATIPCIWVLSRRWYDVHTAMIATLLFTVSATQIFYAQEARPYSGIVFFISINTWLWLEAIKPKQITEKRKYAYVAYILLSTLGAYLHYYVLMVTIAHIILTPLLTGLNKNIILRQMCLGGSVLVLFIPWLPYFLNGLSNKPDYLQMPTAYFFRNYQVYQYNDWELYFWIAVLLYGIHLIRCLRSVDWSLPPKSTATKYESEIFFAAWLALPAITLVILSWMTSPSVNHKSLLFTSPAAYILLARASVETGRLFPRGDILPLALVCTLFIHTLISVEYYTEPQKQPMREGIEYVHQHSQGEPVLSVPSPWFFRYYELALFEEESEWYNEGEQRSSFIDRVEQEGKGWVILANNSVEPYDIDGLLSEIENSTVVNEQKWQHKDLFDQGFVEVRVLEIMVNE